MATKEPVAMLVFICCWLECAAGDMCTDDDHFRCVTSGTCVPASWTCDWHADCVDGSDEAAQLCGANSTCGMPDDFKCKNGRCIPASWRCNDFDDCGDGSDELCHRDCDLSFPCADGRRCVPNKWRCDMELDCFDGSDEDGCMSRPCFKDQEMACASSTPQHQICYPIEQKCDGVKQCSDGSDEQGCTPTCKATTEFDCRKDGRKCVPLSAVCNGVNDCGDNRDEVCAPDTCRLLACQHGCLHDLTNGSHCTCKAGFRLADDMKTCEDIDECADAGACAQECANTEGGYICRCLEGYDPLPRNPDACKATSGELALVVANRQNIREFRPNSNSYFQPVGQLSSAIAIDFDYAKNMLFWSDIQRTTISFVELSQSHRQVVRPREVLVDTDVTTPDGIALDWVHGNLYWTDTYDNTIEVINLETRLRKVLIDKELEEPRGIVVDPRIQYGGFMYWGDWGFQARIEKAGLDGSNREKLVTEDMGWPNGLAIDFTQNRLYWIDAKSATVGSIDLKTRARRTLSYATSDGARHAFGIDVFENDIFWTDWNTYTVFRSNKLTGGNTTAFVTGLGSPMSIKLIHPLKQPRITSRCGANNGGCPPAAICLPSPTWATCQCADNAPVTNLTCVSGVAIPPPEVTRFEDENSTAVYMEDDGATKSCGSLCRQDVTLLLIAVMMAATGLVSVCSDTQMSNK